MRWCSTGPVRHFRKDDSSLERCKLVNCAFGLPRVPYAAPICMLLTASYPTRSCRLCPDMRSSERWSTLERRFAKSEWTIASECQGWTCGQCVYCQTGREKPVRTSALHRISDRWWFCRGGLRRRPLCFSSLTAVQRQRSGAAVVCGTDRLARAESRWQRAEAGVVRVWSGGPYRDSGGAFSRPGSVCFRAAW